MIVYKYPITPDVFAMVLGQFDLLEVHTGIAFFDSSYESEIDPDHLVSTDSALNYIIHLYNGFHIPIIC